MPPLPCATVILINARRQEKEVEGIRVRKIQIKTMSKLVASMIICSEEKTQLSPNMSFALA